MKTKSRYIALLLTVVFILSLSACGTSANEEMSAEKAKGYVQGTLDASYKAMFEEYTKITGDSEEAASQYYEEAVSEGVDTLNSMFNLSDEQNTRLTTSIKELMKIVKYEVGEASGDNENGYEIKATIEPLVMFDRNKLEEDMLADFQTMSEEKQQEFAEDYDKVVAWTLDILIDQIESAAKSPTYNEPVECILHLEKDENGEWFINEEDMKTFSNQVFAYI